MNILVTAIFVIAAIDGLSASFCTNGDLSNCALTCTDPTEQLGCEGSTCTCMPIPPPVSCQLDHDCEEAHDFHCPHGQFEMCENALCSCLVPPPVQWCDHNDASGCNMTCTDPQVVGCEHEKCMCVMPRPVVGSACFDNADCHEVHCEHHMHKECIGGQCDCTHMGPG